jgi:hypothetical protein
MRGHSVKLAVVVPVLGALAGAASVMAALPASAAPSNAPNLSTGTADCGSAGMFTFIVNGNNGQGTPWNGAFLTAADGSRAIFHPASLDLTFSDPTGTFAFAGTKHSGAGPVSCEVVGHPVGFPQASFTGTVTGTITALG